MGKQAAAVGDKQRDSGTIASFPTVEQYYITGGRHCRVERPHSVGGGKKAAGARQQRRAIGRPYWCAVCGYEGKKDPTPRICRMGFVAYLGKPGVP